MSKPKKQTGLTAAIPSGPHKAGSPARPKGDEPNDAPDKQQNAGSDILSAMPDVIVQVDLKGNIIFCNDRATRISGYTREEVIGQSILEFLMPEEHAKAIDNFKMQFDHPSGPQRYNFKMKNDRTMPFEVNGEVLRDENGKPISVVHICRDISQRVRLEVALKNAKKHWETTFDAISDWVCIIDKNHTIVRSNQASELFVGLPPQAVVGKHCYEIAHQSRMPILNCPVKKAMKTGQRETMEIQLQDNRWWQVSADIIGNPDDSADDIMFAHIVRDITDIKQKEEQLLATRKTEAFGTLAGGIAHDYNNLLSIIWGNISLLEDMLSDSSRVFFKEAEQACQQARSLTHQFITLSPGALLNKNPCDINDLLSDVVAATVKTPAVAVAIHIPADLPAIAADPALLQTAFQNIISNAAEAMPEGGQLDIQAEVKEDPGQPSVLQIKVRDSGLGIVGSDLAKIFDPYFTSKTFGAQKGVGLGLAITKSIITKHDGEIHITSTPGQGTTVTVLLPLNTPSAGTVQTDARPESRTILLMESDAAIRKMCERMLLRLNYQVLSTDTGHDIIAICREYIQQNEASPDLIILEYNKNKGIDGVATREALRHTGCTAKTLLVTGDPQSPLITNFKQYGFDACLLKPYDKARFENTIQAVLTDK